MITGSAKLIIDLGNSQTRIIVKYGKSQSAPIVIPNAFADLTNNYEIPEYISQEDFITNEEELSYVFRYHNLRYAAGYLAEREFSNALVKPTAQITKYSSILSKLSLQLAFAKALIELGSMTNSSLSSLDVTWDVVICLPAVDYSKRTKMIELVKNSAKLDIELPVVIDTEIKIDNVTVVPEAVAAFFAVMFDKNLKLRKEYSKYVQSTVMIVDIGAGTTDVSVIQGMKMIDDSRDTIRLGGNNVQNRVNKFLRSEGIVLGAANIEAGVISGHVSDGASEVDISDKIVQAKDEVANGIVSELQGIFESSSFNPRGIQYLLVLGGGSLGGATEPISTPLMSYLRDLAPNVQRMNVPEGVDVRLLNVLGAAVMAR